MIPMYSYDYMVAYMDYMVLDERYLRKVVKFNHSLLYNVIFKRRNATYMSGEKYGM